MQRLHWQCTFCTNVPHYGENDEELDTVAKSLNISRQAVIKTYLRQALDQHYLSQKAAQ